MKTKNKIEEHIKNIKGGLLFGFSALLVMLAGGMIYATLSFPDLETVLPGDTLKSSSWNEMVEAINALKAESNAINTNLITLSGTVANINNTLPDVPNVSGQVSFGGKYYKALGANFYTWNDAVKECNNLGDGWRLPSPGELRYVYNNKSSLSDLLSSNFSPSTRSDNIYCTGDCTGNAIYLDISSGNWRTAMITVSASVICIHD